MRSQEIEQAVRYLRDLGRLWKDSPRVDQRAFVKEVFVTVVVDGAQVAEVTPAPKYEPLFVLDRRQRFGGDLGAVWLPDEDSNLEPSG